jgi:hypothetical protein
VSLIFPSDTRARLGLEGAFVIGALPALLLRTRHHRASLWISAACAAAFGAALAAVAEARRLSWGAALGLSLLGFFCYALSVGLLTTLVAQVLSDRFAIVFGAVNFLALVLATVVQQIGVALDYEASTGYYLMCAAVAAAGAVALAGVAVVQQCRKETTGPSTMLEEAALVSE